MRKLTKREKRVLRHTRIRHKILSKKSLPRLIVFRSLKHIYGQIFDEKEKRVIFSVSDKNLSEKERKGKTKTEKAFLVGKLLAKKALEKGIKEVVFDRGGYKYHGRVKALAEGAREGGMKF